MGSHYVAFISYSHRDRRWAQWLHRKLEGYRFPKALRAAHPELPERLKPIFRDRDELPASGSLSERVTAALEQSGALIVICSPAASRSEWVDREVACFESLDRPSQLYAAVISGDPGAGPAQPDNCYPPSLWKYHRDASGAMDLPAADFRKEGDGQRMAFLKIVAGLAGVPMDALVRRDQARRLRRMRWIMAGSLALACAFAAMGAGIYLQKCEAERQRDLARRVRDLAQGLNTYMIGDLRSRLREKSDGWTCSMKPSAGCGSITKSFRRSCATILRCKRIARWRWITSGRSQWSADEWMNH